MSTTPTNHGDCQWPLTSSLPLDPGLPRAGSQTSRAGIDAVHSSGGRSSFAGAVWARLSPEVGRRCRSRPRQPTTTDGQISDDRPASTTPSQVRPRRGLTNPQGRIRRPQGAAPPTDPSRLRSPTRASGPTSCVVLPRRVPRGSELRSSPLSTGAEKRCLLSLRVLDPGT